jgi:hypothetical protein
MEARGCVQIGWETVTTCHGYPDKRSIARSDENYRLQKVLEVENGIL